MLEDMEVVGSFDLHQHHLFLIDILEIFTKACQVLPPSNAKNALLKFLCH